MPGRTPSWYADPDDAALARWHDGQDWTEFTMVIAEWTSSEPPPPPEGWSPPASPTAGLTPAFGAAAPPPPATPAPDPAPAAPAVPPADEPAAEPSAEEPEGPTPPPEAPDAGADEGPEPGEPAAEEAPDGANAPEAAAPAGEEPRGFARLSAEPGTRAFGTAPPAPKDGDEATPAGEPDDPAAFEDLPTQRGVHIDAETAGPDPDELDDDEPTSGSVQAVGPEAPGIDWGVGPEALKPLRRPSGWHLDEDGNPIGEPIELPKRTLGQQYRHAPIWARIAIPLVLVGLMALAVTSFLGGDDGDDGTERLFTQRDGTLNDDALDEPGMDDALTRARQQGAPTEISDKDLSGLIKGVCTAARRSLVSLNLSQALVDTGLEIGDLGEAATAIGNGSLEYCPDQEASLGQVVSVLITRTQRMLATSTTT